MSFNWTDYYDLAADLIEINTEASFRSAISRAYYAAYNILRIEAGYNSKSKEAEGSHYRFIEQLQNLSDTILDNLVEIEEGDIVYIGNQLDALRVERNKADYRGELNFTKRDALDAYDKVEQILEILHGEEE